jgi:antibiotic biosynthesis monooxygenase (ABM) superfamily enzyme
MLIGPDASDNEVAVRCGNAYPTASHLSDAIRQTSMNETATSTTRPATPRPPVRWKLWLVLVASIYPMITLLVGGTEPLLRSLPLPVRFALLVPIVVATMVWVVLPQVYRRLGRWLAR